MCILNTYTDRLRVGVDGASHPEVPKVTNLRPIFSLPLAVPL